MWSQVIAGEVPSFAGGAVSTLRQVTPHPPQPSTRAFRSGDETRSTAISESGESILGAGRRRVVAVGTSAWPYQSVLHSAPQRGTERQHALAPSERNRRRVRKRGAESTSGTSGSAPTGAQTTEVAAPSAEHDSGGGAEFSVCRAAQPAAATRSARYSSRGSPSRRRSSRSRPAIG